MRSIIISIFILSILSGCAKAKYHNIGNVWKDADGNPTNAHGYSIKMELIISMAS